MVSQLPVPDALTVPLTVATLRRTPKLRVYLQDECVSSYGLCLRLELTDVHLSLDVNLVRYVATGHHRQFSYGCWMSCTIAILEVQPNEC